MMFKQMTRMALAAAIAGPGALAVTAGSWGGAMAADYEINVILPLTGNASFLGQGQQRALKALETAVNKEGGIGDRPLRFVFQDDQTSPQVAVQLTTAAIAAKPAVLMGSGTVP